MGRMKNKKLNVINTRADVVMLNNHFPEQQKLIQANRFLLFSVLVLMAVVFALGIFLLPAKSLIDDLKDKQLVATYKNPVLSAEIDSLKGQLVGLVSGSIEGKLKSLEESIKLGSVLGSLQTVQSLRNDVKVLKTYSDPVETKQQEVVAMNETLIKEVSQLKNLIYWTLGSCSFLFAALAGVWLKNRHSLIQRQQAYLENISQQK